MSTIMACTSVRALSIAEAYGGNRCPHPLPPLLAWRGATSYAHAMRKRRRQELALPGLGEELQTLALHMIREPTLSERRLWEEIRAGKIGGCRVWRQLPIGRFIVDFYCVSAGLVLEVDGKIHAAQSERDQVRTAVLQGMGLRVL